MRHQNKTCWSVVVNLLRSSPIHTFVKLLALFSFTEIIASARPLIGSLPYPLDGGSVPVGPGRFGYCASLAPTPHFEDHRGGGWPIYFTGSIAPHGAGCVTLDGPN